MSASLGRTLALVVASASVTTGIRAQDPPPDPHRALPGRVWEFLRDSSRASWVRPAASLVIPGSGQLMSGADRAALYLVAEAFFLTRFISLQHDAGLGADQYRDLAFRVARGGFGPQVRDTVFDYFETMGKYLESGPFDTDPGPDLVPPGDPETFNGRIWLLARQTFFQRPDSLPDPSSPTYAAALDFYRRRAVGPDFRWSWRSAGIEQDLFRQTIQASDEAYRRARQQLGLLLANHLLSAVDALVTTRLQQRRLHAAVTAQFDPGAPYGRPPSPSFRLQVQASF